jgi:hypothetical protein
MNYWRGAEMAYKKIDVELIVVAHEAEAGVAELVTRTARCL